MGTDGIEFGPFQFVPGFSKTWGLNLNDGFIYTATSQGCGGYRCYCLAVSPSVAQNSSLAPNWMLRGTVTFPFQMPKLGLATSFPNADPLLT